MNQTVRAAAKDAIHKTLHELGVRIPDLKIDGCHCNLVAEVALEALSALPSAAARLAALEARHERIWDVVLELRQNATARNLDPYKDPTAQALSAILTGDTGWRITYGTLVETRDDLETAKARSVALWERTKFEAEEHAHDWEQRPDGSLALVAWDEEQWFDCGPVIQPLVSSAAEAESGSAR